MAQNDDPSPPWKFFPKPGEVPAKASDSSPPFGLDASPLDSGSEAVRAPVPTTPRSLIESEPVSEALPAIPRAEASDVSNATSDSQPALAPQDPPSEDAKAAPSKVSDRVRRPGARPSSARVGRRGSSASVAAARLHSGGAIPAARRGKSSSASGALVGVFGAIGVAALFLMVAHSGSSESDHEHEEPVQVAKASPAPVRPSPAAARPSPSPQGPIRVYPSPDSSGPEDEPSVETVAPPRTDLVPPVDDEPPSGAEVVPGPDARGPDPNMPDPGRPDVRPDPGRPDPGRPDAGSPEGPSPARSPGDPAPAQSPGAARKEPRLAPGEVLERNDDGSIKARYSTDKQGRRNGSYVEYHPNGKTAVKATYRAGELHGTRSELSPRGQLLKRTAYRNGQLHGESLVLDASGKVLTQEYWFEGLLLYPKTREAIARRLSELAAEPLEGPQGSPKLPDFEPYSAQGQIKALRKLKAFRYLCDVSTDVTLSRPYGELASAAAQLLEIVGHLDHNPERPVGCPDSLYVPGLQGLQEGNLHEHSQRSGDALLLGGIDFWIWDSDPTNISRVGHRRWSLNPRMKEVAWGVRGKFTVMYSHDSAREASARDFVAYPSRGFFPMSFYERLDKEAAWSCSFDQGTYSVASTAKVEVCPADEKLRKGAPVEIHDFNVESGGYAQGTAVIFRPEVEIADGARYWVTITGVTDSSGKPVRVQYLVEFVK